MRAPGVVGGSDPFFILEPDRYERFLETLANTRSYAAACAVAGWQSSTERVWRAKGTAALARREKGEPPEDGDEHYIAHLGAAKAARAEAARRAGETLMASLSERVTTQSVTEDVMRKDGTVITLSRTESRTVLPDGNLALRVLERAERQEWASPTQVEIGGQVDHVVSIDPAVLDAVAQRIAARAELEAATDAEVIDADEG